MRSHAHDSHRRSAGAFVLDSRFGVRARPWGTRPELAHLVIGDHTWSPPAQLLQQWTSELRERGFHAVRTGAMADHTVATFEACGFTVEQSLALLRIDPAVAPRRPRRRGDQSWSLSSTTSRRLHPLAVIDRAAFGDQWGVDADGLVDACSATPQHRLRVAETASGDQCDADASGAAIAFAITGRSGSTGFLQRLAVHPRHHGRGVGRDLVLDSLGWLRRRGVRTAVVNTHTDNLAALALYESVGFERLDEALHVLTRSLTDAPESAPLEGVAR